MPEPLRCDLPAPADHAELYELLVSELSDFAVFLTDPKGCIVSWNPGVERLLGYGEAEWLGRPAHIIFTPEDRASGRPEEEMNKAARDGRTPDIRWHLRRDGSRLFIEGTMVALKDSTGGLVGFSKVMRDVTERKQAEETLRASEGRLRALVEASSEVLYRMSPDWTEMHQLGGGGFMADTGSSNRNWLQEYIHPDDQSDVLKAIQQAVQTKSVFELEHRVWRVDGTLGWTHSRAVPLLDANGDISEWFGAANDITERKTGEAERERLHQQVEAERQRLHQVFAQAPVAVVVFRGPEYIVELANPFYQRLVQNRELVGRRFLDFVPEIGQDVLDAFHQVMSTGEPFVRDEFYIPYDQDGDGVVEDHWFNVFYHALREVDGTVSGLVSVCTEVTPQVEARQELERVNRGLEEFAHVASHDLQEPLRMVRSYSQLLTKRLANSLTDEQQEFLNLIQHGVQRMEQLIKDLLSYSRTVHTVGEVAASEASLNEALREALTAVETGLAETGAVITHDPLPAVRGDVTQLAHVFQNLLSNAMKYGQANRTPHVHITSRQKDGAWIVSVQDNGIGFDPRHAERIFGLFKRLHREDKYPGTGLGLAICQRIVERYGGRIWAESEPGVGSTFYFSLPVVP